MLDRINALKAAVLELELAVKENDGSGFNRTLQTIRDMCSDLKLVTQSRETETRKDLPYQTINTIPFVMKPVMRENLFEGNYLEAFSEERTEQLMHSRAINNHNEFWKQHETIRGNVYGSVPVELIAEDSVAALVNYGWEIVEVDILDFGRKRVDIRQVTEFCQKNFDYFILVKESSTDTILALVFNM